MARGDAGGIGSERWAAALSQMVTRNNDAAMARQDSADVSPKTTAGWPHSSLGHLTSNEFIAQRQGQQIVEQAFCSSLELSRKGTNVSAIVSGRGG